MEISLYLLAGVLGLATAWGAGRWAIRKCEAAHQSDWGGPWLNRLDGLNRLFCRRYHRLQSAPIPLPDKGPAVLVSNHVSGLDPLLLIAAARRPLRFMIAEEQYRRFGLTWLFKAIGCIPVGRAQRPEVALRHALRALQAGEVVVVFPQGGIHLDSDPPRKLKGGAVKLAQMARCAIYPLRLSGIRAPGHVLSAVVWRSRARLQSFSPLPYESCVDGDCLDQLDALLNGARPGVSA